MSTPLMAPADFAAKMRDIFNRLEPEGAHGEADDLMCQVLREHGYGDGVDAFDAAEKWYS